MKATNQQVLLHKLLLEGASAKRMWAALIAMGIGLALLLMAILIWWNFNELLRGRVSDDSLGSSFLTVSRKVTNENMGHPEQTVFSNSDLEDFRKAPQVEDVGKLQSLKPRAYMSMQIAPGAGFSTVMILEAVPDRFMDKRPAEWEWLAGKPSVPIILSSSFLSLYNYAFAPGQGLPQLSEETIKALPFRLEIGEGNGTATYTAHVVGFSDRITSVLVPESFIEYSNGQAAANQPVSRLILKVKDPSATQLNEFLESHNYVTNSEMQRWSKLRSIVQVTAGITGGLALVLLGVSLLVFVLFIELTVSRARQSVQLLQEIGYAPSSLRKFLYKNFLPLLGLSIAVAAILAILSQIIAHVKGSSSGLHFALIPGWPMWVALIFVCGLLLYQMKSAIGKSLSGR